MSEFKTTDLPLSDNHGNNTHTAKFHLMDSFSEQFALVIAFALAAKQNASSFKFELGIMPEKKHLKDVWPNRDQALKDPAGAYVFWPYAEPANRDAENLVATIEKSFEKSGFGEGSFVDVLRETCLYMREKLGYNLTVDRPTPFGRDGYLQPSNYTMLTLAPGAAQQA